MKKKEKKNITIQYLTEISRPREENYQADPKSLRWHEINSGKICPHCNSIMICKNIDSSHAHVVHLCTGCALALGVND